MMRWEDVKEDARSNRKLPIEAAEAEAAAAEEAAQAEAEAQAAQRPRRMASSTSSPRRTR